MKKFTLICAAAFLMLFSCVRPSDLNPSFGVTDVRFAGDEAGAEQTLNIKADGVWTIDVEAGSESWLSVTPVSGQEDAEVTVKVLEANVTGADRSAKLTLNVDRYDPATISVIQTAATTEELTDGLLSKTLEGYYEAGEGKFVYDAATMQFGIRPSTRNYRMLTDDQKQILVVFLSKEPVEKETVTMRIQTKGLSVTLPETLEGVVFKVDGNRAWIYNASLKKGFIIRYK